MHLFLSRKPVWATRPFKNIDRYYQVLEDELDSEWLKQHEFCDRFIIAHCPSYEVGKNMRYNHSVFKENYAGKRVQIWLHDSTYDIFYRFIGELPIWYRETFRYSYEFKGYTWKEFYEEVTK